MLHECCGSKGGPHKKNCSSVSSDIKKFTEITQEQVERQKAEEHIVVTEQPKAEKANRFLDEIELLSKKIAELEQRDEEQQKRLKMLYAVADKGRVFNYENSQATKKPVKVKLSVIDGKYIVGWRTVRDELILDPRTGRTVGESQEYEILLYDSEGNVSKKSVSGYLNFSNIRYNERVECEVVGKKENYDGKLEFDLLLPDNRKLTLDSRFVN